MSVASLLQRIDDHYNRKLPFVVYCPPGKEKITGLFQNKVSDFNSDCFDREGFVFFPFDREAPGLQIDAEGAEVIMGSTADLEAAVSSESVGIDEPESERLRYLELLADARNLILQKWVRKVVTSRRVEVPLAEMDLTLIFTRLFHYHTNAFRYLWYHPHSGLWCGATPELLVETDGTAFKTMALAGTRPAENYVAGSWSEKEKEEQQLVIDFIVNFLQKVTSVVKLSKTYTHQAGSVVHLRTDITGILKRNKTTIQRIVSTLHPTSAVCGMPRNKALQFLSEKEGYDREYYSGYLGYHQAGEGTATIFVNLRCMRLFPDRAHIFVGGGITEASDPEAEWKETVNKQQTMLKVLQPLLSQS